MHLCGPYAVRYWDHFADRDVKIVNIILSDRAHRLKPGLPTNRLKAELRTVRAWSPGFSLNPAMERKEFTQRRKGAK